MVTRLVLLALLSTVVAFLLSAAEAALGRLSCPSPSSERRAGGLLLAGAHRRRQGAYLSVLAFVRVVAEAAAAVFITFAVTQVVDGLAARVVTAIGIMALVSFVIVGVSPRTLGRQHADTVALWPRRWWCGCVASWVRWRASRRHRQCRHPGRGYRDGPFQSESELRDLVDLAGESALIEAEEREMIHSVFELGDTVAREVMVPRTDMVTIDGDRALKSAMSLFLRSGFSRIPVVGDGADDVLGLLYFKDVARRSTPTRRPGRCP